MHIVTKILIVFGAILSVLLAALTIPFTANAGALRLAVANEQAARLAAESERGSGLALAADEKAKLEDAVRSAEGQAGEAARRNAELQNERSKLIADVEIARQSAQGSKNQIDNLTAANSANAAVLAALQKEVSQLRDAQVQSSRRETELVDRLNDLEGQRQVLDQNTRALQEQLAEARLTLEQAKTGSTAAQGKDQPFISTGPLVTARVKQLFKSPAGDDLVIISEGANAGLKVNQKMLIIRGKDFVADLVIVTVDQTQAVGRIDRLGRTVEVMAEDLVLSSIR